MLLPVVWIAACETDMADLPMLRAPMRDINQKEEGGRRKDENGENVFVISAFILLPSSFILSYPTASITPIRFATRGTPFFVYVPACPTAPAKRRMAVLRCPSTAAARRPATCV